MQKGGIHGEEIFARSRPYRHTAGSALEDGYAGKYNVITAIESGRVAGAALDVFEVEPPSPDNPLILSDKAIATPHLGGSTQEAQKKVAIDIAHQIIDFATDGVIENSVNIPPFPGGVKTQIAPFLLLTERLARFISLVTEEPFDEIEIEYRGGIAEIIGDMHLGSEETGGRSLSLFDLDQTVDDGTIATLLPLAGIISVKRLDLS